MAKKHVPAAAFGNRIVGHGMVKASDFLGNELNFRVHPGYQREPLSAALTGIGFVQSVIVNKRSAPDWGRDRHVETVVDGHLRIDLALERGDDTEVPVSYVDLTPDEERAVLATLDPIAVLATTDQTKYDDLVGMLPEDFQQIAIAAKGPKAKKQKVSFEAETAFTVTVTCENEQSRDALMARLTDEGFTCHTR